VREFRNLNMPVKGLLREDAYDREIIEKFVMGFARLYREKGKKNAC